MFMYADDGALIYSATTPLELNKILQCDFSLISDWYTYNRLMFRKDNVLREQNNVVKI